MDSAAMMIRFLHNSLMEYYAGGPYIHAVEMLHLPARTIFAGVCGDGSNSLCIGYLAGKDQILQILQLPALHLDHLILI